MRSRGWLFQMLSCLSQLCFKIGCLNVVSCVSALSQRWLSVSKICCLACLNFVSKLAVSTLSRLSQLCLSVVSTLAVSTLSRLSQLGFETGCLKFVSFVPSLILDPFGCSIASKANPGLARINETDSEAPSIIWERGGEAWRL